ncbi:MAG: cobalamin-dependent protein [Deltaproteobacteria bacterium]|nr:cobalamin-dependent protein [Deltaproteobacteria bacterium]
MESRRKHRLLIGSIGLDGHELGALIVSKAIQKAGMEVVYLGLNLTPEEVVESAIQEDVDMIGISSMSGIHIEALSDLMRLLRKRVGIRIPVIAGGIIPPADAEVLKEVGVLEIFPSGSSTSDIIRFVNNELQMRSGT